MAFCAPRWLSGNVHSYGGTSPVAQGPPRSICGTRHNAKGKALLKHACHSQPAGRAPASVVETEVERRNNGQASTSDRTLAPASSSRKHAATVEPVTEELLRDHRTLFSSLLQEYAYWVQPAWVSGTIPPELQGTYYRNGPGLQISNPRYQRHTFDGDGMVLSLAFSQGRAFFRNKFVRTKGFVAEQAAGKPVLRNSFSRGAPDGGLLFNPFDLTFKNVANTGVLCWAGKLYALWEAGMPHLLDARTLDTLCETSIGGQVAGPTLAGHYRVTHSRDPDTGAEQRRWVTFGTNVGFGGSTVTFYEFNEQGRCMHTTQHKLASTDITFVHDMLVTEHYYVLVMGPIKFNTMRFATEYVVGRASIAECLQYNPSQPTKVMLYPRPGRPNSKALVPHELETIPFFAFHHVNAYEAEGGSKVVVDTIAWDSITFEVNQYTYGPDYYKGGSRSEYYRLVCDLPAGKVSHERLLQRTVEFPTVDPRVTGQPHSHAWFVTDKLDHPQYWGPAQAVMRTTLPATYGLPGPATARAPSAPAATRAPSAAPPRSSPASKAGKPAPTAPVQQEVWLCPERSFPGEPMFIPRPGSSREGDGWLLVACHNAGTGKADIHLLEALDLGKGPVATIHLPHHLPAGLHGSWEPSYMGPDPQDASVPKWQQTGEIRPL